MSEPGMAERPKKVRSRFSPLRGLPWRSGGASALLIVIMSSFDDSLFSFELLESASEGSSSSDQPAGGRRVRAGQRAMPVKENGQPDPNALTDQDYSDIPSS
jgi:hypothetical protein